MNAYLLKFQHKNASTGENTQERLSLLQQLCELISQILPNSLTHICPPQRIYGTVWNRPVGYPSLQ